MPLTATDSRDANPASGAKAKRVSSISQTSWAGMAKRVNLDNRVNPVSKDSPGNKPTARRAAVPVPRVHQAAVRMEDQLAARAAAPGPAATAPSIGSGTAAIPAAIGHRAV